MYDNDNRIVMTLDAGGTNFVFSAVQGYNEIVEPLTLPAIADNLDECLNRIAEGFDKIKSYLPTNPHAISFAFPGPADYKNGIIGDLPNLKAFRGGVALGPFLQKRFGIPVYINNDGNLFAYGEALYGALPMVNKWLADVNNPKRYTNLLGITLGTGFGAGVVIDNILLAGDNGCGGDLWCLRNKKYTDLIIEESVSIRAIKRVYGKLTGTDTSNLTPKDIFDIAEGQLEGNKEAAIASFEELGEMTGDALAAALTMVDGLLVIGGGLTGASKYILPAIIKELRQNTSMLNGAVFPRMEMDIYNLMDSSEKEDFLKNKSCKVKVPQSDEYINYDNKKQAGVLITQIGTNRAVMYGAYAFALQQLDKE
ncbi:glucokinase [Dysgonomonas alginatilytica]|uniref:Glucokinase n=1 Tax=Dysgonomonas alginatilytica TaxID=1605892 RepID=A0A2V3PKZ3_9BACT|nr:ROK family protein [Dysgonomonas alginatilytica]PXV59987.1 glucokinase [Dysgonomonas alginatilytica]